jgi:hypothetical protein
MRAGGEGSAVDLRGAAKTRVEFGHRTRVEEVTRGLRDQFANSGNA